MNVNPIIASLALGVGVGGSMGLLTRAAYGDSNDGPGGAIRGLTLVGGGGAVVIGEISMAADYTPSALRQGRMAIGVGAGILLGLLAASAGARMVGDER